VHSLVSYILMNFGNCKKSDLYKQNCEF